MKLRLLHRPLGSALALSGRLGIGWTTWSGFSFSKSRCANTWRRGICMCIDASGRCSLSSRTSSRRACSLMCVLVLVFSTELSCN